MPALSDTDTKGIAIHDMQITFTSSQINNVEFSYFIYMCSAVAAKYAITLGGHNKWLF